MPNVQITDKELSYVWLNPRTQRIMGFLPSGWKIDGCICIPLIHSGVADEWYERFRQQQAEEFMMRQYEKSLQEDPQRKELRRKLIAHRNRVGPEFRKSIDKALAFLDAKLKAQERKLESAALVEMYDASKRKEDIALDSPAFQSPAAS